MLNDNRPIRRARRLAAFSLLALTLTGAGTAVRAADKAPEHPAAGLQGSADAGAPKAAVCLACHGPNGNSVNPEWPVLAGQNASYVAEQLALFKAGVRPNPLMMPIVAPLNEQDFVDLAAYFAAQTPVGSEADPSYWQAGEKLYRGGDRVRGIPGCVACHGPVGRGVPAAAYPALRAQHATYTIKQLNDYAGQTRYIKDEQGKPKADANVQARAQIMISIAARLTPEDRRNLASYLQGMR